jgi:cation:H+ antiporter
MTLGAAAVVRPLRVTEGELLHLPMVAMLVALGAVLLLAAHQRTLDRFEGVALLAAYPVFVVLVLLP